MLGWQCYWMAAAGVTAVPLTQSPGFNRTDSDNPAAYNHWVYQLFNHVPNFKSLKYVLSLKYAGTKTAIEAQNADLVSTYAAYPGADTRTENGNVYAVVMAWDLEAIGGVYDNFMGQAATATYIKGLAAKFKAIGYDGVMILARLGGAAATTPDITPSSTFSDQRLWVRAYNPNAEEITGVTVNLEVHRIYN